MLFVMLYVPVNKYLSDGPFWPNDGFEQNECEDTWWTNLLYINNIVKSNKQVTSQKHFHTKVTSSLQKCGKSVIAITIICCASIIY